MANPEDEVFIDLSTSCTAEAAAAKMIGWMKDQKRAKVIKVTEAGIDDIQLPYMDFSKGHLAEYLNDLRESASVAFLNAIVAEEPHEACLELENKVKKCDELIRTVYDYLADINEEINKEGNSELTIDKYQTENRGEKYITHRSLEKWALKHHGIDISGNRMTTPSPPDNKQAPTAYEESSKGGLSKTKAKGLYVTLAFLVDEFAKSTQKYRIADKPNNKAIAEHICKLARDANNGENLQGQSSESIKSRIEEAMRIKKENLPQG